MSAVGAKSLLDWFSEALPFEQYIRGTVKNHEMWHGVYARVRLPAGLPDSDALAGVRLLVIAADWCGDAVNTVPVVARAAKALGVELRVLDRDEHPELMDRYLTDGRSRSIPVVIGIDAEGVELGWWGPRPSELQAWVLGEGRGLDGAERYKEQRRWYARDRGRTTLTELFERLGVSWRESEPA